MLDEPTAGMSVDETHTAVELIRRLTEGKTMVIIEHDMDVVFSLADMVTVLVYGENILTAPPEQIRECRDALVHDISESALIEVSPMEVSHQVGQTFLSGQAQTGMSVPPTENRGGPNSTTGSGGSPPQDRGWGCPSV